MRSSAITITGTMAGDVVAEQDNHIGLQGIGPFDDGRDVFQRHPGIAGMEIGDGRDRELKIRRPMRWPNMVARDAKPKQRLDAETIGGGREAGGAKPGNETKETTACEHDR